MEILGLELPLLKPHGDFVGHILKAAEGVGGLRENDLLVVSSKAVATSKGRLEELSKVKPSARAKKMAKISGQLPEFVEIVLREADRVLGVRKGAILTIKKGILCANAGVDLSNAPPGFAILMPSNPDAEARKMRKEVSRRSGRRVGIVISDSNVKPLRVGTVGQAVGSAGFDPVVDYRGHPDLYGRPLRITFQAIADQLATAAQLVMGEGAEKVPAVIVRGLKLKVTEKPKISPTISPKKDLYAGLLNIENNSRRGR